MNPLVQQAVGQLQNLKSGQEFLVKDLFYGYVWNNISRSDRLTLGVLFKNTIINTPALNVTILSKTSSNQQKYRIN